MLSEDKNSAAGVLPGAGAAESGAEAGGRGRQEGAVAGAAVEDEAVFQDQAFFAAEQSEDAAQGFRQRGGNVDREALVEVRVPGDVAFEEDFVAGEFEPEAGRLARFRFDVVDGDFGQPARSAARGCPAAAARRSPGFCRLPRADGQPEAPASKTVSLQRAVAPGLTLSPTGRSTRTVFSSSTGVSPGGSFLMMNWVKPQLGWAPAVSKNWSGVAIEQSSAPGSGGSALQVPACQPESTDGMGDVARGDDVAGVGERRRDQREEEAKAERESRARSAAVASDFSSQEASSTKRLPEINELSQYIFG